MTPADRPSSPRQAAQLRADIVFLLRPDRDLFDAYWPEMGRPDFKCVGRVLPIVQTDSPRPFRFLYDIAASWPLDHQRN